VEKTGIWTLVISKIDNTALIRILLI
jgi:hypothetical protein